MAGLDFCSKHNMVAYLEKTDGNTEFHQIMDFLIRSSIHYALTVSPIVSTSFVEQFWTTAKSRTVNNISYIDATVAGKPVTISEASIRSDLLFDDADGIYSLNNQAIFDDIQLMGYEGDLNTLTFNKALFSPQWKFLFHTMNHCISSKSTSWDQIPTNIATTVICLATNKKYNFSKLIFGGMMRHLDATKKFVMYPRFLQIFLKNQLKDVPVPMDHFPVPTLTKKVLTFMIKKGKNFSGKVTPLFDSMLVQPTEDEGEASERPSNSLPIPSPTHPKSSGANHGGQSSSDNSLSGNEGGLTLQSVYDLYLSLCTQVTAQATEIKNLKAYIKQLKKKSRPVINHHKAWFRASRLQKQQKEKGMAKSKKRSVSKQGRKTLKSSKDKGSTEKGGSSESAAKQQSTDKPNEGTSKPNVGTYKVKVSTNRQVEGTGEDKEQDPSESVTLTAPTNTDWYDLDMDIDETMDYTLVQDKGSTKKGGSSESAAKQQSTDKPDEGTSKPNVGTDKVKVSTDRQVEGTGEDKEQDPSECVTPTTTPTAPTTTSTPTPTVIGDDETIAQVLITMSQNKVKQKEKEKRVELLDIERPGPTSTRSVLSLRPLPKIDPKAKGKGRIKEEDESKTESEYITEVEKKFKQLANDEEIARKVQKEWEAEEEKKRLAKEEATMTAVTNEANENFVTIGSAEDERLVKEINEKVVASSRKSVKKDDNYVDKKYPIIEWNSKCLGTKPQYDETKVLEKLNLNKVVTSNGQKRFFSTLMKELSIFDREDLNVVYQLVMDKYKVEIPEGFNRDWKIVSWKLHSSSRVHTLMTEEGIVIHMLVDKKYPLKRNVLLQMLELKLESEEDSTMALELIRFVKKLIVELEPDGDEKDL
ncbi:hypothetical protein Tco_1375660 [Tanacetum coccineum]